MRTLKALPVAGPAARPAVSHQPQPRLRHLPKAVTPKKVKHKRKRPWWHRAAEEAFDLVEDIFD